MNSSITINGKNYGGKSIIISNGKVIIIGVDVTPDSKTININVVGDIDKLEAMDVVNKLEIKGNVNELSNTSGDIEITGNVNGNIESTSGDIEIDGDVSGSIDTTSGDVRCKNVGGSVKTISGDIRNTKNN